MRRKTIESQIFCMLVDLLLLLSNASSLGPNEVPFTPVAYANERSAVCMDGSPAGYYHSPGCGDGARNWIVYLEGGGWCANSTECQSKRSSQVGSSVPVPLANLTGILSARQHINPDFYNWNRIYVHYCDQSSFLGDTEIIDEGLNLQFRGSRIFDAVMEDLLAKGMYIAENAILAGRSAGGLATILHCDDFRALLPPFVCKVKCISDAGFFIRAKDLPYADYRENFFASTIKFHDISTLLPSSCTSRIDPSLCFFPEYLVGDVQTPLFLLNSAFDFYQLRSLLVPPESIDGKRWGKCLGYLPNCTAHDTQLIMDFGETFLKSIQEIPSNPSRGVYIHPCLKHTVTMYKDDVLWNPNSDFRLDNLTIPQAVSDWYFDGDSINVIETNKSPNTTCPVNR